MKQILVIIWLCITTNLFAQVEQTGNSTAKYKSITLGILQGGGSLLGFDAEFLLTESFGVQVGAGYIGFGGGITYHLKPTIRSSFLSLQYWNQGLGASFAQNSIGPSFVYRGKKWFTAQLGLAVPIERGPAFPPDVEPVPVMLMYSIGAYLPF